MNLEKYNYDCVNINDITIDKNVYDKYIKHKEEEIIDKEKREWKEIGFWGQLIPRVVFLIWYYFLAVLVAGFMAFIILDVFKINININILYFLWIVIVLYILKHILFLGDHLGKLEVKKFRKRLKNGKNNGLSSYDKYSIYLGIERSRLKDLGRAFTIKYNDITQKSKREYFGAIFILFPLGNEDYQLIIDSDKNGTICNKAFKIKDITSLKQINSKEYGDNINSLDVYDLQSAELRAVSSRVSAEISGGGLLANVSADKARIRANKQRRELEDKQKRIELETYLILLEFKDGDKIVISNINKPTLRTLEKDVDNAHYLGV